MNPRNTQLTETGNSSTDRTHDPSATQVASRPVRFGLETIAIGVLFVAWFVGITMLLRPPADSPKDFFQDYTSARNLLRGRTVYPRIEDALYEYTGRRIHTRMTYNAHPPTSVLLAIPFTGMPYVSATVWWSLLCLALLAGSLAIIRSELNIEMTGRGLVAVAALMSIWPPLWEHLGQGQLSIPLLFVLTLAWRAARRGKDLLAGSVLAFAAAIKVFPALLLVYFLIRRRFRLVAAGLVALILILGLTLCITGFQAYRDYLVLVLPTLKSWNDSARNASLNGFFSRLLNPVAAKLVVWIATGWLGWVIWNRASRASFDQTFALALTGLLLMTPLTWPHSLIILVLPLGVFWRNRDDADWIARALAIAAWLLMSMPQPLLPGFPDSDRASIPASLGVVSLNFYGLAAFFLAQARTASMNSHPEQIRHVSRTIDRA